MAAVSPVGRAAGLEPLEAHADTHSAGGLYERHAPRVFAYCLSKLGRREDAEDAVQTTFLHAMRGLRRGVVPSVELAWLLGIARNVCLSRFESAGRRGRLELVCDPVDLERSAAPPGRRDELIGLERALAQLPEQQRRAVLLRDWRGLSYEEVAAQLGVSLANAETLIFRGRRTLAELLQEEPSAVRRRLGAVGNLGSLASGIKTAFTGAAAATKVAAVVTAIAVSGAGVAAGTGALGAVGNGENPAAGTKPRAGAPAAPAVQRSRTFAARTPATAAIVAGTAKASSGPTVPATADREHEPTADTPAPSPTAGSAPTPAGDTPAAPTTAFPVPTATVPTPEDAVATTTGTVQSTVDQIVPELPLETPELPDVPLVEPVVETVIEPVVETVPTVTVALPVVEPVTVDASQLLP